MVSILFSLSVQQSGGRLVEFGDFERLRATDAGGGTHSATYPCNVPDNVKEPTRNAACDAKQATDKKLGCTYPWGGIDSGGVKLTCCW